MNNKLVSNIKGLLAMLAFINAEKVLCNPGDAEQAFRNENYSESSKQFLEAEIDDPGNFLHSYNRAVSQFREKKFEEAAGGFLKGTRSEDKNLAGRSWFNLGNTQVSMGKLEEAVKSFGEALKLNQEDTAAKENLAWTKKQIEELKKQQNQQSSDKNQQQDQKSSDKDQQQDQKSSDKDQQQDQKSSDKDQQQNQQSSDKDQQQDQQSSDKDQQQDQQSSDKDQQQNQQSSDKDQQQNQQSSDKDQQQDQQSSESEKNAADDNEQKSESSQSSSEEQKSDSEQQGAQAQPLKEGEISEEAARRLLRSLEDKEEFYGKPIKAPPGSSRPEKDW